ncbi:SURF1 family protein [Corynebacterium argentoratense]|uniref:SURF1 family cytochrome oxidase biogenesis protein n=1 Tax=Corynebacterium argentoratense TaxID=42817 RepID=UPI0028E8BB0A|nr:SURF1 family protein [Corynebacterium argentoratense]
MAVSSTRERRYERAAQKKGWRTFLRPGWVFGVLAIIAFSYFSFTFLAPWQLSRDGAIVERNDQIEAAFEVEPVPAEEVFDAQGSIEPEEEWARVILEGHYLPEDEVLMRNRPVDSSPAFHALTPFQLNSGEVILVNRGFQPPFEGGVPPMDTPPTGEQSILGHARFAEQTPMSPPIEDQGYRQVYGINTEQIAEVTGTDLAQDYVQLAEGQAGEINAIPVPMLDRGSHLSYAFQWIAFGIMAPLGLGYFIWAELKERRRVRREEAELSVDAASAEQTTDQQDGDTDSGTMGTLRTTHPENDTSGPAPTGTTTSASSGDRSRMLHDRYGDSRPDHSRKFARRQRERF